MSALFPMVPMADTTPIYDRDVLTVVFQLSGATLLGTLILLGILSFFNAGWADAAKLAVLALGVGTWVITSGIALQLGKAISDFIVNVLTAAGLSGLAAGSAFSLIVILLVILAFSQYRKKRTRGWLVAAILLSGVLFITPWARDMALWYAQNIAVPFLRFVMNVINM